VIVEQETAYQLAQLIAELGRGVVFRNLTVKPGASPAPNPPQLTGLAVNALTALGAGAITLKATFASGRLIVGDKFTIAGDATVYTVTGEVIAASNSFAAVPISPVLAQAAAANAVVTPIFVADFPIRALVTAFPARLINGTSIQVTDRQVRFLASTISGIEPAVTDKILIGSDSYSIVAPKSAELQGVVYSWFCQVRR
jgi:hypothetical protein